MAVKAGIARTFDKPAPVAVLDVVTVDIDQRVVAIALEIGELVVSEEILVRRGRLTQVDHDRRRQMDGREFTATGDHLDRNGLVEGLAGLKAQLIADSVHANQVLALNRFVPTPLGFAERDAGEMCDLPIVVRRFGGTVIRRDLARIVYGQ